MSRHDDRRSPLRWLIALLLFAALAALTTLAIYQGIGTFGQAPVNIVIDGDEVLHGLDLAALSSTHRLLLALAVMLLALVVLPTMLLVGGMLLLVVLLAAIGLPLLVAALVLALVFSPVLLMLLLLWWLLRGPRKRSPPATGPATMP